MLVVRWPAGCGLVAASAAGAPYSWAVLLLVFVLVVTIRTAEDLLAKRKPNTNNTMQTILSSVLSATLITVATMGASALVAATGAGALLRVHRRSRSRTMGA